MSKESALAIIEASHLTEDEKMMWVAVLENQGEKALTAFLDGIGEDSNMLRIATEFLKARLSSDALPQEGQITPEEHELFMKVVSLEKAKSDNHS